MSHFSLLVTVDGSVKESDIEAEVGRLLDPFDENTQVTSYMKNTKHQLIDNERDEIRKYEAGTYAEYLKDPKAYAKTTNNRAHLRYLGVPQLELPAIPDYDGSPFWEKLEKEQEQEQKSEEMAAIAAAAVVDSDEYYDSLTFPEKLRRVNDDEFLFKLASRWHSPLDEEQEGSGQDTEGNEWSTYNPLSQWDWWVIGGRWDKLLNNTAGRKAEQWNGRNVLLRRDLRQPESTFAYLTKDGEWNEKGSMGWFGMVSNEQEQENWDKQMAEYLLTVPGTDWLVVVDCHI